MTIPFWCLFVLIFFPYTLSSLGGYIRIKTFGKYDNKQPRSQAASLDGMGARFMRRNRICGRPSLFFQWLFLWHISRGQMLKNQHWLRLFLWQCALYMRALTCWIRILFVLWLLLSVLAVVFGCLCWRSRLHKCREILSHAL